jgi:hypothetical protein
MTITVTAGKQFAEGELITTAKLNALGLPTISVPISDTTPLEGQALVWDAATQMWVNGTVGRAYVQLMTGCQTTVAGAQGLVPAPAAGDGLRYLAGDATWKTLPATADSIANIMFNWMNHH